MNQFFYFLEIIGTIAFSISGAILGIKKNMDIFGVIILGLVTAIGGGIIRDITLGHIPPRSFQNPTCAAVALLSALAVFVFYILPGKNSSTLHRGFDRLLLAMDSLGLGIFTINGITSALQLSDHYNTLLLVFVGGITGVGGGILRDILVGDRPYVFIKHIYACASIFGAILYIHLLHVLPDVSASLISVATIVIIRFLSSHFRWNLPTAAAIQHRREIRRREKALR